MNCSTVRTGALHVTAGFNDETSELDAGHAIEVGRFSRAAGAGDKRISDATAASNIIRNRCDGATAP